MIPIRFAKTAMVAAVALFATLVAFGNLTDYDTNFVLVEHVLSMDSIFPDSRIGYRAITSPLVHSTAYALIIATEVAVAVLCWAGVVVLLRNLRADARAFQQAKTLSVLGLILGYLLWQVGFMSIGGEWFGMWQSSEWNGVPNAFRFTMVIAAALIFLAMRDEDLERPAS